MMPIDLLNIELQFTFNFYKNLSFTYELQLKYVSKVVRASVVTQW